MPISSDSDEDSGCNEQQPSKNSINEMLKRALLEASEPGVGDEAPEVLVDPNIREGGESKDDESGTGKVEEDPVEKQKRLEREERDRAIIEEEKRQAELNFDHNALCLPSQDMKERTRFIPIRLTYEERKTLRLVNAAIHVSDYTTTVDNEFKNKNRRSHLQLQHIVAFLSGLVAATNYDRGQEVLEDRNFVIYEDMLQTQLEIARRYKITNPEKMRSEYGKLVYLVQDAVSATIKPLLEIKVHRPIKTVYELLKSANCLDLLDEPGIATATEEILPDKTKSRHTIQLEIKRKGKAADTIVKKYSTRLNPESLRGCLYSISDNNSFLNSNKKPVMDCIELLKTYFSPDTVEPGFSLSIDEAVDGARLSHSHKLQYNYVLQSLTLWAAILEDMFRLWYLAEQDLLSETQPYELKNTGQGLQRVQESPRVFKAMHELLARTKLSLGGWVGSSVIHLGDHNVPNALMFIDKYTQVPRILNPIVIVLKGLPAIMKDPKLRQYVENTFGSEEELLKDILVDFFRHAFDGSGADNFFDAGSCIDGRLTSAWNWCSKLEKKAYYPVFKLAGFTSFDGDFQK